MLMLDCGLRISETVSIKIENIQLIEKYMVVDGKGNKQRIVPLGIVALESIKKYLDFRRSDCGILFYGAKQEPLKKPAISMMFQKLKKATGIERLHAHLLRHTFATLYLENGGNIYSLQAILGHTSLEMVKKYLHLSRSKILSDFHKFSPMDNLDR
jgi:integrase/recombinase XerC/integrase/recombinase XerD